MNLLTPISEQEFNSLINIKFNNICEGFNKYSNRTLEVRDDNLSFIEKEYLLKNFLLKSLEFNNGSCYIDFYIKNLNSKEIQKLILTLNENHRVILEDIINYGPYETVYFKLEDATVMDFITSLNTRELFFCTIYFKTFPLTIWGNFNLKFPVFFQDKDILKMYKEIALSCNLIFN